MLSFRPYDITVRRSSNLNLLCEAQLTTPVVAEMETSQSTFDLFIPVGIYSSMLNCIVAHAQILYRAENVTG